MPIKILRRLLVKYLLVISVVLMGCQSNVNKENRIVAKINDFEITYGHFEDQFKKVHPGQRLLKATKEMKQSVLDNMIEQQLILFEAYRLGYDHNEKVLEYIVSREKVLAGEALRKREVDDKVISEEVIGKYYRWLDRKVNLLRMKFVFTSDDENKKVAENKAQKVHEELQTGADFKKLAAEYSEHATAKKDSGNMKIVGCFDVYKELFEKAYQLSEGEFSQPFMVKNSFYIIKVEKVYPETRGTLEEEKTKLIDRLKEYYKEQLTQQFYRFKNNIMDEYEQTLNLENVAYFCKKAGTMKTRKDSVQLFNDREKKLVLGRTSFEETTIGKFLPLVFEYYWESLNQERLVKMLLSERMFRRTVNHKGMQLKLNELPEVREELEQWKIYYLKKFMIQMEVMDKVDISDMVLIPIYQEEKSRLKFKEQRLVREIFCKTKEDIEKVYHLAVQGHDFQNLEIKYQENRETRNHGIIGPFTKGPNGKLGENAFNMKVNEISQPFKYRGGYSIIRLLSIEPERQKTYDEAKEEIKANYINENKKKFISDWIDQNRENYSININEI